MTEENNNQEIQPQNEEKRHWTAGSEQTLKWLLIWAAAFLGGFLAVMLVNTYTPFNQQLPPPRHHWEDEPFSYERFSAENDFRELHPEFEHGNFEHKKHNGERPGKNKKYLPNANPIGHAPFYSVANIEELPDKYKITVNLRKFNNDEKNVKVDIKPHLIKISGNVVTNTKEEQSSFSYSKSLTLSKKIDTDDVKKEVMGSKLIITAPFED